MDNSLFRMLFFGVMLIHCTDGYIAKRSVSNAVTFTHRPTDKVVEVGGSVEFKCVSDPEAIYTHWKYNGIRITTKTNPYSGVIALTGGKRNSKDTLHVSPVGTEYYGNYSCEVVTPIGLARASAWLRGVHEDHIGCSLEFVVKPENRLVEVNEYVELQCLPRNADSNTTVTWYKAADAGSEQKVTSSSDLLVVDPGLVIPAARPEHTANYTCMLEAANGCQVSSSAEVIVYKYLSQVCGTTPQSFSSKVDAILDHNAEQEMQNRQGHEAPIGSSPWQVSLQDEHDGHFCVGVVVTRYFVLTAANCFIPELVEGKDERWRNNELNVLLRFGRHHLLHGQKYFHYQPHEQVRRIDHIFLHPYFKRLNLDYDLALLRLQTPLKFTDYVRPICLPVWDLHFTERSKPGRLGLFTGWGGDSTLKEVELQIKNSDACSQGVDSYTDSMFCTGSGSGRGPNACRKDSGGPLAVPVKVDTDPVKWYVVGIISSGAHCGPGEYNQHNIFSNVSMAKGWLIHCVQYYIQ